MFNKFTTVRECLKMYLFLLIFSPFIMTELELTLNQTKEKKSLNLDRLISKFLIRNYSSPYSPIISQTLRNLTFVELPKFF